MNNMIQPPAAPPVINNPLQALHDIHLPADPPWWPLAPGWWIVLGAAITVSALILIFWWRKHRWQKNIQTEINTVIVKNSADLRLQLAGLSSLLRRVALYRFPKEKVASLHGRAWLEFLQSNSSDKHFEQSIIEPLAVGAYQARPGNKPLKTNDPLVLLVHKWIRENLK